MQMQLVYNGLQGFTGEFISIVMGYLDDCMAGRLWWATINYISPLSVNFWSDSADQ